MKIYYQPHKSRKREAAFVEALMNTLPITEILNRYYPLPSSLANWTLDIAEILQSTNKLLLSDRKKVALIDELRQLPPTVKVVLDSNQISCDVVIVVDGMPHYFEFHEEQHRRLTITRSKKIYSIDDELITVPRYLQRFLRDIWRVRYLRPYMIVWSDWFEQNGLDGIDILHEGFAEHCVANQFNFNDYY